METYKLVGFFVALDTELLEIIYRVCLKCVCFFHMANCEKIQFYYKFVD